MRFVEQIWYEATKARHSTRTYNGQLLSSDLLTHLNKFTETLNMKLRGARVVLVEKNPDKVFKGIIGSYGKVKDAPIYAAFIGDLSDTNAQEKTGYLGELFIIQATALGLSSCWIGGFFDSEAVKEHIKTGETEKILAVSPLGYGTNVTSLQEKLMKGMVGSYKRKSLHELCSGLDESKWSEGIKSALELARLAPSAVNRQPWRFTVEADAIKVSVDSEKFSLGVSKRLDCGIAMAHIEIGAAFHGLEGDWEYLDSPDVARFIIK